MLSSAFIDVPSNNGLSLKFKHWIINRAEMLHTFMYTRLNAILAMFHILLYHFSHSFISLSLSMNCKFDSTFTGIFLPLTK